MSVLESTFKKNFFFFYCSGCLLLHGLSLIVVSGGYSFVSVCRFLIAVFFCSRAWVLGHADCGVQT